jgi:hypothetical protein
MFKIKNFTYVLLCAFAAVCSIKASQAPAYDASLSPKEKYHRAWVLKNQAACEAIFDNKPLLDQYIALSKRYEIAAANEGYCHAVAWQIARADINFDYCPVTCQELDRLESMLKKSSYQDSHEMSKAAACLFRMRKKIGK